MIDIKAFFKVSYGLYIVSSGTETKGNGFVSNSVFQVTAEPAQFAACCNKDNLSSKFISESGYYSISILKKEASLDLIGLFGYKSGRDVNKFETVECKYGETGVPIVTEDAVAYFECKVVKSVDVGTHIIYIGEVVSSEVLSNDDAITYDYYRNVKNGVAPKNAPTFIDKSKLVEPKKEELLNDTYKCPICGYEHDVAAGDPKSGIDANIAWEEIDESYKCPLCGAGKEDFYKL